ncbi:LOG family protein [Paraburkholderia terricola]|uniref:AMP nucleosidase n=1 Tax=Paraburkholderia terricola TaxID=169427 RepID=A0A1M6MPV2_9BURK|nr:MULTISPECIES: LOG family protein [Paraburkholderia]SDO06054.1 Predicted Rossmann fold nucleotide-binding protein [Paraburkholderia sediminicola]SHJ85464.1 Predicted Rossmann fold nucleotide-binding protein [Paraburkholderia terricola]
MAEPGSEIVLRDAGVSHAHDDHAIRNAQTEGRIRRAKDMLRILVDESSNDKPVTGPGDEWLVDLLARMKTGNFITQNAHEYVHRACVGAGRTDRIHTGWSELSGDTAAAALDVKRRFADRQVVVSGFRGRKPDDPRRLDQFDAADAIVLTRGDFHAPYQFIEAIDYLRSARAAASAVGQPRERALVVADFGFYRPLLRGMFGAAPRGVDEKDHYRKALDSTLRQGQRPGVPHAATTVQIVDSLDDVARTGALTRRGPTALGATPATPALPALPASDTATRNVAQLFVGTTKQLKIEHWRSGFGSATLRISSLIELIDDLGEPEERHGSYVANVRGLRPDAGVENSGKAESFVRVIRRVLDGEHPTISREALLQRLASFGVDAERGDRLHFIADDRGLEFPDWPLLEPYFPAHIKEEALAEVERRVGGQDPAIQAVPGVETTWWINTAGGTTQLLEHFMQAYERRAAATGERLEPSVVSVCVASLVDMDLSTGAADVRNFSGATTFEFRRPPAGAVNAADSEAWFVPAAAINPESRSVQELMDRSHEGAYTASLPWVKAIDAMRADGVTFENTARRSRVPDYRVSLIGQPGSTRGAAWQERIRALAPANATRPDPAGEHAQPVVIGQASAARAFDPYAIGQRVQHADAVVFDAVPGTLGAQATVLYEYFSALVLTSLHPDYKNVRVLVNEGDPHLAILQELVRTQHLYGLSENPLTLSRRYDEESQATAELERHWAQYERIEVPQDGAAAPPNQFDVRRELDAGRAARRPAVVVLASGKAVEPSLVAETTSVARWIAGRGDDAIYGGGAKGLMGEFYQHYQRHAASSRTGGKVAGISTTMVIGKETTTSELPAALDVGHVSPDIITRMHQLFEADMAVFLAGGVGTAEEIGFALALKAAGVQPMRDKPMILVNSLMPDGKRLCDGYLEYFGAGDPALDRQRRIEAGASRLKALNVHVVQAGRDDFDRTFGDEFMRIRKLYGIGSTPRA